MTSIREQANNTRNLQLEYVAGQLGGCKNQDDRHRWDFPTCAVWIGSGKDNQRFYDHHASRGGGGALDLAMYVLGCDFKAALTFLLQIDGKADAVSAMGTTPRQIAAPTGATSFEVPKPCPQYLPQLSEYLNRVRGLPPSIVTHAINLGLVYADTRRNAVFLCHAPRGQITGAELRGTGNKPFKGMASGSRRGIGFFTLPHTTPTQLVVVESALDALAYSVLFPSAAAVIVSTAGILPSCPVLLELATKLHVEDIVIAYDNDAAGDYAGEQLINSLTEHGRTVRRRRPWNKDWNEVVIIGVQGSSTVDVALSCKGQTNLFAEVV